MAAITTTELITMVTLIEKKIIFIQNREWRVVQDKFSEFNEEEKPKNHSSKNSIQFGREMSVDGIILTLLLQADIL